MTRPMAALCRIAAGGFSGERVVHLTQTGGADYTSLAPRQYCWKTDGEPLGLHEPEPGKVVEGLVAVRVLREQGGIATISLPDGSTVLIPRNQLRPRPTEEKEAHVPV